MDKTEKFIRDGLSKGETKTQFEIDAVIAGTHSSIKKRATRRKAIYSSPIAILVVILGIVLFPGSDEGLTLPGGELLMAGLEHSWTETQNLELEDDQEDVFYEQTVDYLFDDNYYTYFDDSEALLDETDLEALEGYLKEA